VGLQKFKIACEDMLQTKGYTDRCTTCTLNGKKSINLIATIKRLNHLMVKLKKPKILENHAT
jgi:hypothetical protein